MLSWLKQHKNTLILGVLVTVLGGVILYFIIPQSQANIIVTENTSKDWCQQTYGIKTPPKYIQNQSTAECFYPLVYSIFSSGDTLVAYGFFDNQYTKPYQLNMANLTTKYDLKDIAIKITTRADNYILFSCNRVDLTIRKGYLYIKEDIPLNKEIFCAIVIQSENQDIQTPKIYIYSAGNDSQEIPISIWNEDSIGFSPFYSHNIFEPMNKYYIEKGVIRHEI
ncbi:hypothetical protein FNFX1_1739 [Francisella cf. novicida Fx1]|uniref:hypothetical protein n=1 Tax=Francisella tularensis TaxID=263 RepID=UPI00020BCFC3|nr:hypothetical protein [Francisella tularensis]AEE88124.1 hypothetical protein FNFX1_1739 [Francisella cf. novicida Fx1]